MDIDAKPTKENTEVQQVTMILIQDYLHCIFMIQLAVYMQLLNQGPCLMLIVKYEYDFIAIIFFLYTNQIDSTCG